MTTVQRVVQARWLVALGWYAGIANLGVGAGYVLRHGEADLLTIGNLVGGAVLVTITWRAWFDR